MKSQMMFRGEAKKTKPNKLEKVYNYFAKLKRREEAKKKEAAASA